jgi:hypothetical protein
MLDSSARVSGFNIRVNTNVVSWTTDKIRGSPCRRTEKFVVPSCSEFLVARVALKELRQVKLAQV